MQDHLNELKQRYAKAVKIKSALKEGCLYFAVGGGLGLKDAANLKIGTTEDGRRVTLRAVELNPLATEAFGATTDHFVVPYMLKHSGLIHSELEVERADLRDSDNIFKQLRPITLCLSLSVEVPIYIPFVLNTSWSSLPAFRNREIEVKLTDSGYEDPISFTGGEITAEVATFVDSKIATIRALLQNNKFQIAVDAYEACLKLGNKKIAIATAWTGIEAIFGISSELKFRTALYAASELAEANDPYITFLDTKALYDLRSKVVHGSSIKEKDLNDAYGKSLGLLLTLLRVVVRRGNLRDISEIEKSILSSK
ncbi:HEPN domain-containing protein [Hyphococcus flavus]|uniref:HEPN domain-containing protein n=1 Tax=Hyphococcus flavus TaxID=1866326 RepID=A0AAF0CFW2_9PROT|nr:HEPN domain-containing protein [Hyphococcus flavus]WDI32846.1 HEPN domain-containing protein [Hyphococcus flavus]